MIHKQKLTDIHTDADSGIEVTVEVTDQGVFISFDGYGDCISAPGFGIPVQVEIVDGEPMVRVWHDINRRSPTHVIGLAGAKESLRKFVTLLPPTPATPKPATPATPKPSAARQEVVTIRFNASGTMQQTLRITEPGLTPKKLVQELNSGFCWTSIHGGPLHVKDHHGATVATVLETDNLLDYDEFELVEDENTVEGGPDISQLAWQPPEAMQRNRLYLVRRKTGSTSPGKEPVLALYFVGFIGLSRQDVFDASNAEACVALAEIDAVAELAEPATATPSSSSTRGASMRR